MTPSKMLSTKELKKINYIENKVISFKKELKKKKKKLKIKLKKEWENQLMMLKNFSKNSTFMKLLKKNGLNNLSII